MAEPLPEPYPPGSTVDTIWLDATGQPTTKDQAVGGERQVIGPDGEIVEWAAFDLLGSAG